MVHKKTLKDNGVKLLSAMEQIPDTPEGNLMEALLEGFNQYFSEELSQKVRRGIRESWIKGNSTGQPLYGYDTVNKKYVVNECEAAFVRDIFTMYAQGYTVPAILEEMLARGAKKRSGKPFDAKFIYNILHNVRYTGRVQHDGVCYDNIFPAIVSQDIWDKIDIIKEANKIAPSRKKEKFGYILSGKLVCGNCKHRMKGVSGTSKTGATHHYYVCGARNRKTNNCDKAAVLKKATEDIVIEATSNLLATEENIDIIADGIVSFHNRQIENDSTLKYLVKRKDAAVKASNNIIRAIEQGIFTEQTKARMDELETKITQLQVEINREQQRLHTLLHVDEVKTYLYSILQQNNDDYNVRKLIVNTFVREIILYEDKMIITYYCTDKHDKVTVDVAHIKEVEQEIKAAPKVALFLPKSSYIKKSFTPATLCKNAKGFSLSRRIQA